MDAITYVIPAEHREAVEKKLGEMNLEAEQLGTAPISVRFERDRIETRKVEKVAGMPEYGFHEYSIEWLRAFVTGAVAKVDGFTFLATLHHMTDGNIISAVPGHDVPREYRNAPSACHHCKTIRRRSATYLVQNEAGKTIQVDCACLTDFFGRGNPHAMAKWAEALGAFDSWFISMGGRRPEPVFSLATFLGYVAAVIRKDGWLSKAKAMNSNKTATASIAWNLLNTEPTTRDSREFMSRYLVGPSFGLDDADKLTSTNVTAWAETEFSAEDDTRNGYLHNLSVVSRSGLVNLRTSGLAASMIAAYRKAQSTEAEREALKTSPSQHVGALKERLRGLPVTLLSIIDMEPNDFGPRQMVKMQDLSGNLFVWFTGNSPDVAVGGTYYLTGTVKRHGGFNGQKQTELSRCELGTTAPIKKEKISA